MKGNLDNKKAKPEIEGLRKQTVWWSDTCAVIVVTIRGLKFKPYANYDKTLLTDDEKEVVKGALEALGFDFVADAADAQMLVSFVVATRQEISSGSYAYPDSYWWGVYGHPMVVIHESTERREAYLAIDLAEAKTSRPLWRGWAQQPVSPANRSNPVPLIKKAVTSILDELPGAARPAG